MAGELIKKINELKKLVFNKSNKEFKKNAIELLTADALDEMIEIASPCIVEEPTECCCDEAPCNDTCASMDYENYKLEIKQFILEAIADEEAAVAFYLGKARECNDLGEFELAELFKELAGDEMVHSASLRATLEMFGLSDLSKELEGRREAFQILAKSVFESADEDEKKAEAVEKEADKVRKDFDFAEEYSKNKAEYNKEKVAGVINDLIAGKRDLGSAMEILQKDCKKVSKAPQKGTKETKKDKK